MDLAVAEYEDACRTSIYEFGEAIMDKDYNEALYEYGELGYRIAFLKDKLNTDMVCLLNTILLTELEILEALGDYIKIEGEELEIGDLRLVQLANVLIEKTVVLLHKYYPLYSSMMIKEMASSLGLTLIGMNKVY